MVPRSTTTVLNELSRTGQVPQPYSKVEVSRLVADGRSPLTRFPLLSHPYFHLRGRQRIRNLFEVTNVYRQW